MIRTDLLLQALVRGHTEVVGGRVDGSLRAQAAIGRILGPCRCKPRVDRALRDSSDRLVLRVVDLVVAPLEHVVG